jgi:hypothetical protein
MKSHNSPDNIEIAPFDNLLVYKKEYTPEKWDTHEIVIKCLL